jgi:hypothetical protein
MLRRPEPPVAVIAAGHAHLLDEPWREWLAAARARERALVLSPPCGLALAGAMTRLLGHPPSLPPPTTRPIVASTLARRLQLEALRHDMHMLPVVQADRLFLGCGVETRMPFLDRRVIDAALGLSDLELAPRRGLEKPAVREIFARLFGTTAPRKRGFSGVEQPGEPALRAWIEEVRRRGTRVVDAETLAALGRAESWMERTLAWRGLLLEECYDLLGCREPPDWDEG